MISITDLKEIKLKLKLKSSRLGSRKFNLINWEELSEEEESSEIKQINFQKKKLKKILENIEYLIEQMKLAREEVDGKDYNQFMDTLNYFKRARKEIKKALKSNESSRYLEGLSEYYNIFNDISDELISNEKIIKRMIELEPEEFLEEEKNKELYDEISQSLPKKIKEKYDDYTYPIPKKRKRSCEGNIAPEGWKFQECKDDFISLLRIKEGDWSISWDIDRDIHRKSEVKDYYVYATMNTGTVVDSLGEIIGLGDWYAFSNLPLKLPHTYGSIDAVKVLISVAECVNSGNISQENLNLIMKKWLPEIYFISDRQRRGLHRDIETFTPLKDPTITRFCNNANTYEEVLQCDDLSKKWEEERKRRYEEMECFEGSSYGIRGDECKPKKDNPFLSLIKIPLLKLNINKMFSVQLKSGKLRSKTFLISPKEILEDPFESDWEFMTLWKEKNEEEIFEEAFSRCINYSDRCIKKQEKRIIKEAVENYHSFLDKFSKFGDPFIIHRAIGIDNFDIFLQQIKDGKKKEMGIYWSWNEKFDTYWLDKLKGNEIIVLSASVYKKDINWKETILSNTHLMYDVEDEITLKKGAKIRLFEINRNWEETIKFPKVINITAYVEIEQFPEEAQERWRREKLRQLEMREKWDEFSMKERWNLLDNVDNLTDSQKRDLILTDWNDLPSEIKMKLK